MLTDGKELSVRQAEAIGALVDEGSFAGAARKTRIAETTLRRWFKRPNFRAAYDERTYAAVDEAAARLRAATLLAVRVLIDAMRGKATRTQLVAAEICLSKVYGARFQVEVSRAASYVVETPPKEVDLIAWQAKYRPGGVDAESARIWQAQQAGDDGNGHDDTNEPPAPRGGLWKRIDDGRGTT